VAYESNPRDLGQRTVTPTALESSLGRKGWLGRLVADREIYNRANQAIQELAALTTRLNNTDSPLAKLADPVLYKRLDGITQRGEQLLSGVDAVKGRLANWWRATSCTPEPTRC
jgi:hypothetical protein